jgi:hypothetical protein
MRADYRLATVAQFDEYNVARRRKTQDDALIAS